MSSPFTFLPVQLVAVAGVFCSINICGFILLVESAVLPVNSLLPLYWSTGSHIGYVFPVTYTSLLVNGITSPLGITISSNLMPKCPFVPHHDDFLLHKHFH